MIPVYTFSHQSHSNSILILPPENKQFIHAQVFLLLSDAVGIAKSPRIKSRKWKTLILNRQFKRNVWFCCVSHRMCGYYSPSEPLTFLSSRNVMLVTMATDDVRNFPGFRAQVSQIKRGSKGKNYLVTETHEPFCHHNCLKVGHQLTFFVLLSQKPHVVAIWQVKREALLPPTFQTTIHLEPNASGRSRWDICFKVCSYISQADTRTVTSLQCSVLKKNIYMVLEFNW